MEVLQGNKVFRTGRDSDSMHSVCIGLRPILRGEEDTSPYPKTEAISNSYKEKIVVFFQYSLCIQTTLKHVFLMLFLDPFYFSMFA